MEEMDWQEKLRAFSAGELSPGEKAELLREAAQSETKTAELKFSQKLATALKERELFEIKGIVAGLMQEEGLPPTPPQSWIQRLGLNWIWGLGLLLLLSGGLFFVVQNQGWWPQDPQTLAQQYLQPLENVVFIEDNESTTVEDLRAGMDAYELQNYTQAILRLNSYYTQTQDANAGLFLAVSHLMKNQPKQALPILLGGLQKNGPVQETSRWYLALAYLQQADAEAAIRTLQTIPPTSIYGAEAQELLEKLK